MKNNQTQKTNKMTVHAVVLKDNGRVPTWHKTTFSGLCFLCNYPGHSHKTCHLSKCNFCHMYGHVTDICPYKKHA